MRREAGTAEKGARWFRAGEGQVGDAVRGLAGLLVSELLQAGLAAHHPTELRELDLPPRHSGRGGHPAEQAVPVRPPAVLHRVEERRADQQCGASRCGNGGSLGTQLSRGVPDGAGPGGEGGAHPGEPGHRL